MSINKKSICETSNSGNKYWWLNGKLHREDGPAIEYLDGTKAWFLNGKLHREDGPAIELLSGHKEWWLNGLCHRSDGPAVEYVDGHKEWHYYGKQIDCKDHQEFLRMIKLMVFL